MEDLLPALAVISVNYDSRAQDPIDIVKPLVADRVLAMFPDPVSDHDVCQAIERVFSLRIPRTVVKTLLRRMASSGLLERRDGVFFPIREKLTEFDLTTQMASLRSDTERLLGAGVTFAKDRFDLDISVEDLSQEVSSFVSNHLVPSLKWATGLGVGPGGPDRNAETEDGGLAYVAAQYVLDVMENGDDGAKRALGRVAKGALLAVVLWTSDVSAPSRKITDLRLFLDTTLLLRCLGLCGSVRKAYSDELRQFATEAEVGLFCFEHTLDELKGILDAAESILRVKRGSYYGEAVEYMVSSGWEPSDVIALRAGLEGHLDELGVTVVRRPDRVARYNMNERELEDLLTDEVNYRNPKARDVDIDSLASIFTFRKARRVEQFERCSAAFVTTNASLVRAARRLYLVGEEVGGAIPLALLDAQVATYLWARSGATGDLPSDLLSTSALSLCEGNPVLWIRYVEKIEKMGREGTVDQSQYVLLRQSLLARSIILTKTSEDPEAFTEDTAKFVLAHAHRERELELEAAIRRKEGEARALVGELSAERERTRRVALDSSAAAALRDAKISDEAKKSARRWVRIGQGLLGILVVFGVVLTAPWPQGALVKLPGEPGTTVVLLVILVGLTVLSLLRGASVISLGRVVEEALARRLAERYEGRFGSRGADGARPSSRL